MQVDMRGRVALITGGSKGIGYALAQKFTQCGARVSLLARDEAALNTACDELNATSDGCAHGVACDVSDASGVQLGFDSTIDRFGQVDILINNAGFASAGAFEEITDDQ